MEHHAPDAVTKALGKDTAGVFDMCDPATRARYAHAVAELSRGSGTPEVGVAEAAVDVCAGAQGDARASHVGWVLAGEGRRDFEKALGYRPPWPERAWRAVARYRTALYIAGVLAFAASAIGMEAVHRGGRSSPLMGTLVALLLLPLAVSMGRTVVRSLMEMLCPPSEILPRLDFRAGIPEEFRTCVVSPVIINDVSDVETVVENMERNFRGNRDPNILYVMLADLPDASTPWEDGDREVIDWAERAVTALNTGLERPVFHVLFRKRTWNEPDRVWMGWERKRGKIEEFNRVVLGDVASTSFLIDDELAATLASVVFVVTLDADIRMQRDGVIRLAGTLAHPLNRPVLSEDGRLVTSGHGILRPGVDFTSAGPPTVFRLIAFGCPSADYAASHEHVAAGIRPSAYQDFFAEDVFIGQGIYDVRAFAATLGGHIPENSVLSHDKLEGMHARAAYVADTVHLECPPSDYLEYRRRHHRWVRGDFHLIPWLFTRGHGRRTSLSALNRWNIFTDLMEHLRYAAAPWLLFLGWLGDSAVELTFVVVVTLNASVFTRGLVTLVGRDRTPPSVSASVSPTVSGRAERIGGRLRGALSAMRGEGKRRALWMVFVLDSGLANGGAAVRSLYRTAVSRRNVLQWTTAAKDSRDLARLGPVDRWRVMAAAPALSLLMAVVVVIVRPENMMLAAPFLSAWFVAPQVAHVIGGPAGGRTSAAPDHGGGKRGVLPTDPRKEVA